jgi:hypothetical protein
VCWLTHGTALQQTDKVAEGKDTSRQAGRQGHQPAKGDQRRLGFIRRTLLAYHNPAQNLK